MGYIGFLMLLIGAAGVDGNNMLASGIIALIGLVLLAITSVKENSLVWITDQSKHTKLKTNNTTMLFLSILA